jgi:hypothetical protein
LKAGEGPEGPTSPRRVPQWQVDEDARRAEVFSPAEPTPRRPAYGEIREDLSAQLDLHGSQPRPPKKRSYGWLIGALVTAGLLGALQAYQAGGWPPGWTVAAPTHGHTQPVPGTQQPTAEASSVTSPGSEEEVPTQAAPLATAGRSKTTPTPGRESQPAPLGSPAPLTTQSDSYAFLGLPELKQDVVAYDPCRPVHYVTRAANSPEGGQDMINKGFTELSRVTGLQFINDGETSEAPSDERPMYQPDSYGDRWVPVLVAWSNSGESPRLSREQSGIRFAEALGYAGSLAVSPSTKDRYVYVTGQVVLNTQALAEASAIEGPTLTPSVIAHELAHLVGLDHVDDPTELMHPEASYQRPTYADGDLTGLAALGRGTCSPGL